MEIRPKRAARVIDEAAGDEIVVYNLATDAVSLLNRVTAAVWCHCDGENSVDDIVPLVASDLEMPVDSDLVRVALRELADAELLADTVGLEKTISRRKLMKRLAIGAAALPLVTSIAAPTAAAASSHGPCEFNSDCGPGQICSDGTCVPDPNICNPPCNPATQICTGGFCSPIAGTCDPECGPNEICSGGVCEPLGN